ncbi:MAG: SapC family protein [Alsobacter sp.]
MYERLRPLDKSIDLPRMPAPETCFPVHNPIAISIAPIEAAMMIERFPIAWRHMDGEWDLVALTGLVPSQDTWRPGPGASGARVIPLLLRAYPLALLDDGRDETVRVLVDEPALLTPWHPAVRLYSEQAGAAELEQRLQALWAFANSRRALQPAFRDVAADGAFKPWDLSFRSARQSIALDGFFHVDWDYLGGEGHRRLVERHGWLCASLLAFHRMSLHRVSALLRDLAAQEQAA